MQLTVRTTKDDVRARVLEAIPRIAKAAATGGEGAGAGRSRIDQDNFTPALYNNAALAKKTRAMSSAPCSARTR